MRVNVSCQQYDLKKQHAAGPDRRSATKPRQNKSANQWLHLKQQKGTDKYCESITQHRDHFRRKSALYCADAQKEVPDVDPSARETPTFANLAAMRLSGVNDRVFKPIMRHHENRRQISPKSPCSGPLKSSIQNFESSRQPRNSEPKLAFSKGRISLLMWHLPEGITDEQVYLNGRVDGRSVVECESRKPSLDGHVDRCVKKVSGGLVAVPRRELAWKCPKGRDR